jgi:hypothetical protein
VVIVARSDSDLPSTATDGVPAYFLGAPQEAGTSGNASSTTASPSSACADIGPIVGDGSMALFIDLTHSGIDQQ